jgi:5'-nucleotidase
MVNKTKLFLDMDGVLADFIKAVKEHPDYEISNEHDTIDQLDVFGILEPMEGAIEAVGKLWNSGKYDMYIASTAPWDNVAAWTHKRQWIERYLPMFKKRLILTHHKDMLCGNKQDIIIDDRLKNGVEKWNGVHLHYGTDGMETWVEVLKFLGI